VDFVRFFPDLASSRAFARVGFRIRPRRCTGRDDRLPDRSPRLTVERRAL
jgi:hypothetical protein